MMQQAQFVRQLKAEGYEEVLTKSVPAGEEVPPHSHPFTVKALVTSGDITLGVAGGHTTYRVGDVFTMASGCAHTELCGASGVTYVVGRKHG